jgi:hypothetical protein
VTCVFESDLKVNSWFLFKKNSFKTKLLKSKKLGCLFPIYYLFKSVYLVAACRKYKVRKLRYKTVRMLKAGILLWNPGEF